MRKALRSRPARFLRNLLWAAADLYMMALVLYLPLRFAFGDALWPVALASTFLHGLLMPAFVLLPLALWRRRWLAVALAGVNAATFLWLFGGLFLPAVGEHDDPAAMTFMTANLHVAPPAQVVELLRASGADVIGLQEVRPFHIPTIEAELAHLYPYQVLRSEVGTPGKGLLSRYPILEYEFFSSRVQYPYLRAALDVEGSRLTVLVAHLPSPSFGVRGFRIHPAHATNIAMLIRMAVEEAPTVMLGDFNTTDQNDNYALMVDAGLIDAFRAAGRGLGLTWPDGGTLGLPLPPLVRIDYVWYTPHLRALAAWVGPGFGSDHYPVLARLAWR